MKDSWDKAQDLKSAMESFERSAVQFFNFSVHLPGKWGQVRPEKAGALEVEWAVRGGESGEKIPPLIELRALLEKARRIYKKKMDEEFTTREIRLLPYILLDKANSESFIEFLFSNIKPGLYKRSRFKKVFYTYLSEYSRTDPRVQWVRQALYDFWEQGKTPSCDLLSEEPYLLEKRADEMAAEEIVQSGIALFLQNSVFPKSLYGSNFIKKAIECAFGLSISGGRKLELLYEMMEHLNYRGLFSDVISPCIIYVDDQGSPAERQKLLELILKTIGDPRGNNAGWGRVTPEAKKRVFSWLVEQDFDFFFAIIEKTATVTVQGQRMWGERRPFWEIYKNEITASRIVLGYDAQRILPNIEQEMEKKLDNYDFLRKTARNTSLLVFKIRSYIFIEVSHNGKLRIFDEAHAPVSIYTQGGKDISYTPDITRAANIVEIAHYTGWQSEVRDWIYDLCGIWREENQWRP